jgi:hypothetical protein
MNIPDATHPLNFLLHPQSHHMVDNNNAPPVTDLGPDTPALGCKTFARYVSGKCELGIVKKI